MSSTSQFFESCWYFPSILHAYKCSDSHAYISSDSHGYISSSARSLDDLLNIPFSYFNMDPPYSINISKNIIDKTVSFTENNFNSKILHCNYYTDELFVYNENINMFDSIFSKENSKENLKENSKDNSKEKLKEKKEEEIKDGQEKIVNNNVQEVQSYFPVIKCSEPKYNPASFSINHDENLCDEHPLCMYELMFNNSANITSHVKFVMDSFDFYRPKNNEPFVFELGCIVIETCDKEIVKPKQKKN